MILIIDNYDSFTYNLVQALGSLGADLKVVRNDKITVAEIEKRKPEKIIGQSLEHGTAAEHRGERQTEHAEG